MPHVTSRHMCRVTAHAVECVRRPLHAHSVCFVWLLVNVREVFFGASRLCFGVVGGMCSRMIATALKRQLHAKASVRPYRQSITLSCLALVFVGCRLTTFGLPFHHLRVTKCDQYVILQRSASTLSPLTASLSAFPATQVTVLPNQMRVATQRGTHTQWESARLCCLRRCPHVERCLVSPLCSDASSLSYISLSLLYVDLCLSLLGLCPCLGVALTGLCALNSARSGDQHPRHGGCRFPVRYL